MWAALILLISLSNANAPAAATKPEAKAEAKAEAKPAMTADKAVENVQAYYASIQKLSATFRQVYENTTFGKKSISDGRVYIAKPGKMRWDYEKPEKKYFISDGTTLWVYEEANKQAFKQDLKGQLLPVAITFLYGQGDLKKEFNAALDPGAYGGKGDVVVKLTPKQPSAQYKHLWLVVDPADWHVKESIILEASDNLNRFTFSKMFLNDKTKFKDRSFQFEPPEGVKVIEPPKDTAAADGAKGAK